MAVAWSLFSPPDATTTTRSTQLAEGVALLDIEPVKARCVVDTYRPCKPSGGPS